MIIMSKPIQEAHGVGHRRIGYDHCTSTPGPTTAALAGRLEGKVRLPERVRTTLHTGPVAAAAREPAGPRASTDFPKDVINTDSFLSILVHTRPVTKPSHVHPVHLQRLKLVVMRKAPLADIGRHGAHGLGDNAEVC